MESVGFIPTPSWWNKPGWSVTWDICPNPIGFWGAKRSGTAGGGCWTDPKLASTVAFAEPLSDHPPFTTTTNRIVEFWYVHQNPNNGRYEGWYYRVWEGPSDVMSGGNPSYAYNYDFARQANAARAMEEALPAIDPMTLPVNAVQPAPVSAPIGAAGLAPNAEVIPRPARFPRGRGRRPPKREKPKKKTKERKLSTGAVAGRGLSIVINQLSEAIDYLDALYYALPRDVRERDGKDATPQRRALTLYQNMDEVDVGKAMLNLIANEIEDRAIGKAASGAGKLGRHLPGGASPLVGPAL